MKAKNLSLHIVLIFAVVLVLFLNVLCVTYSYFSSANTQTAVHSMESPTCYIIVDKETGEDVTLDSGEELHCIPSLGNVALGTGFVLKDHNDNINIREVRVQLLGSSQYFRFWFDVYDAVSNQKTDYGKYLIPIEWEYEISEDGKYYYGYCVEPSDAGSIILFSTLKFKKEDVDPGIYGKPLKICLCVQSVQANGFDDYLTAWETVMED